MSIVNWVPFYSRWHNVEEPNLTTPIDADALNNQDDFNQQVADAINNDLQPVIDMAGSSDGDVVTRVSGALIMAAPTDVGPAVTTYLSTHPTGSVSLAAGYLSLPGINGSYAQCPDAAGLRVAGDIDIRWYGSLGSLTGSGFQTLVMKQNSTATAWMFRETAAGKLQLSVSADGTTIPTAATCSVTTAAASGYRVTWTKSSGQVQFFKLDPAGSVTLADGSKWTQLGTNQTTSTSNTSLYSGAANPPITIGAAGNGTSAASSGTVVTKVEIRSGLDGTLVANPNFTNHTYSDPTVVDSSSNVFTLAGLAQIVPISGSVLLNSTTLTFATPNDVRTLKLRWGAATRNPFTGWFHVDEYGPVGVDPATWTTAQTGAAVRAARDAAVASVVLSTGQGATVYFGRGLYVVDHDPSITDPFSGLNYCAIKTWDYLTFKGAGRNATMIQLAASENCHVFGHPGRQMSGTPPQPQDQIMNVGWVDMTIDGNKANQSATRTHDGLHIDQHPAYELHGVTIQNCDGRGLYTTAVGEFGTGGAHAVREPIITDSKANNNASWGWFLSATNRVTSYKGVYASGNGSSQALIVGKTVAVNLTGSGHLDLQLDNHATIAVSLLTGDTPASVVTKINTALAAVTVTPAVTFTASDDSVTFGSAHGIGVGCPIVFSSLTGGAGITAGTTYYVRTIVSATKVTLTTSVAGAGSTLDITSNGTGTATYGTPAASLSTNGRLKIASGTWGGWSKVYLIATSTINLADIGLTTAPVNGDNNYRCGANETGGFFLDHSECVTDGLFADSNNGDGFYIHNVNACHYKDLHATRNNGHGIYVDALNHSTGSGWVSMMNCFDFGAASYRTNGFGSSSTAELYFDNGTEGYGVTKDSTIIGFNGPGDKTTIGSLADNRLANYAIVIAVGVAANGSFDIAYPKYGDGGLLGTLQDNR